MTEVRGSFDLRLHITAASEAEAWQLAKLAQQRVQLVMPEGVRVRYVQLRRPGRSPVFEATMTPRRAK